MTWKILNEIKYSTQIKNTEYFSCVIAGATVSHNVSLLLL